MKKIENKEYLLISTADRESGIEGFDTYEEAWACMRNEMEKACGCPLNEYFDVAEVLPKSRHESDDGGISEASAWLNDGPNHADYDWEIIHVEPNSACRKTYAVITTYSFDASIPVVLFSSYEAACNYLCKVYNSELMMAVDNHDEGYVTESFIEEDMSYAKIVDAFGEDTTEWVVENVSDGEAGK